MNENEDKKRVDDKEYSAAEKKHGTKIIEPSILKLFLLGGEIF